MGNFFRKFKSPKFLLKLALIALIYYLSAKFGLSLAFTTRHVTLVWPPTGISLALLLLLDIDLWPGIFIGSFFADFNASEPLYVSLGIGIGSTLEALFAVYFLKRFQFNTLFRRLRDVLLFLLFGVLLNSAIGASIGTLSLLLGGISPWNEFSMVWINWWVGDALGAIVLAPIILVWSKPGDFRFTFTKILELIFLMLMVLLLGALLFTGTFSVFPFVPQAQFKYLIFPLFIWASYRYKQMGSTLAILLITAVSIWGAITGAGPFVIGASIEDNLLYLASFIAATAITFLVFSAIVQQKEDAEGRVGESEAKFKALIENSYDAIVLVNAFGKILYASPATERFWGYKPEEIEGKDGFELIYKPDVGLTKKLLLEGLKSPGKNIPIENRIVRKDGEVRWSEGVGTNLLTDPAVGAIVINFRDVTDRKQMDQVKSEFVSLSAHQLRAPLSSVRWYTESAMKEKKLPAKVKDYLSEAYTSILTMNDTVNLLLEVSRFELGTVQISGVSLEIGGIIDDVIKQMDHVLKIKNISIIDSTKGKIPKVIGDSKLIRVIIENLFSNAIKYSNQNGKIDYGLKEQSDTILFTIKDEGVGIPLADQPKIFTKLFRGSNVKSMAATGLGLGLYLTKMVIDFKGGRIWFESGGEGKGTTFFVEFPKDIKNKNAGK